MRIFSIKICAASNGDMISTKYFVRKLVDLFLALTQGIRSLTFKASRCIRPYLPIGRLLMGKFQLRGVGIPSRHTDHACYSMQISTSLPLKATPYLQMFVIPFACISAV